MQGVVKVFYKNPFSMNFCCFSLVGSKDFVRSVLGRFYTSRLLFGCRRFPLGFLLSGSGGGFALFLTDDSEKQERDPLVNKKHNHQTGACILV